MTATNENTQSVENVSCQCGDVSYKVGGAAITRVFCHCTICQEFNQAPFADITIFRPKDVKLPPRELIHFKSYLSPKIVFRGKCKSCHCPVVETIEVLSKLQVIIVPTANIKDQNLVSAPTMHTFYHSRVKDIDDDLPKYSGYLRSQAAFAKAFIKGIL